MISCRCNSLQTILSNCQDLLTKILLPFSAKTLITLKLVSKQFNYVISDQDFGIQHVRFHHKNRRDLTPTGIFFYSSFSNCSEIYSVSLTRPQRSIPSLSTLEFVGFLLDRQFKIVQACNGLLLCSFDDLSSSSSSSSGSYISRLYCVCNPTTYGFTMLPDLAPVKSSSLIKKEGGLSQYVLALAFNPLKTHVYKVFGVRVVKKVAKKCTCELIVYSSDEGGRVWRKVGRQFEIPEKLKTICHGLFHDGGKITWICERGFIHFDVHAEKVLEVTRKPRGSSSWKKTRFFGESIDDGRLQVVRLKHRVGVDLFQLRPETLDWERLRIHAIRPIIGRHQNFASSDYRNCQKRDKYQILGVGRELVIAIPGKVFCYCPVKRESRVLRQMPEQFREDFSFDCVSSFQFVETLSPV
ncbi:hypothetical protein LIER_03718 [Lithospermum erythrorhizon]|uniref:F-box domain-containing protein n=1 Tax=Lithospermum erythrorhizon TaxID=34254 RepID=A0AAV3NUK2_LITER